MHFCAATLHRNAASHFECGCPQRDRDAARTEVLAGAAALADMTARLQASAARRQTMETEARPATYKRRASACRPPCMLSWPCSRGQVKARVCRTLPTRIPAPDCFSRRPGWLCAGARPACQGQDTGGPRKEPGRAASGSEARIRWQRGRPHPRSELARRGAVLHLSAGVAGVEPQAAPGRA